MTSCRRGCDSGPRDRYQRSRGPTCFVSVATSACGPKAAFLSPFGSRGESETRRRTDTQSTTPVCECQRPTAVNATRSPLWEGSFHHTGGGRRRSGYPPNVAFSCEHREQARRPKGAVRSVGVRQRRVALGERPSPAALPGPPQIRTCGTTASGSSVRGFATRGERGW